MGPAENVLYGQDRTKRLKGTCGIQTSVLLCGAGAGRERLETAWAPQPPTAQTSHKSLLIKNPKISQNEAEIFNQLFFSSQITGAATAAFAFLLQNQYRAALWLVCPKLKTSIIKSWSPDCMVKTCHDGKGETMSKVRTWGGRTRCGGRAPPGRAGRLVRDGLAALGEGEGAEMGMVLL